MVEIRRAQTSDLEALRELYRVLFREHAAALPDVLRVPEPPEGDAVEHAESLINEECFFAVAEVDGRMVGFIDASRRDPTDPADVDAPWCNVNNVVVHPSHARAGVGSVLLNAAEEWAKRKGFAQMRLTVFEFNAAARAFYERAGYGVLSRQLLKRLGTG